jgi:hypothetical protein
MAGSCVEKIFHDTPNCSSTNNSLQVFLNEDGTFSGTCFSCGVYEKSPYGDNPPDPKDIKVKSPEDILAELKEIHACGYLDFNHRSINVEDWKFYGVKLLYSEFDGKTPYALAHPYSLNKKLVGYKVKLLNRKVMWSVGNTQGADLYGWERAKKIGGQFLYITEGEEDAIALRQILRDLNQGTKYADLDYACVSLPRGVKDARKAVGALLPEIEARFDNVVLVFDDDEPGQLAAKQVKALLPNAMRAVLPCKDANKCLIEGRLKATRDAVVFRASKDMPFELTKISSIIEESLQPVEWGASYPWNGINNYTYGQRLGELISIGGGTGCGKTLTAHELIAHDALVHGWNCFGAFLEESNVESVRNLVGKIDSVAYHIPDTDFDKDVFRESALKLSQKVELWNPEHSVDPDSDWSAMKQVIKTQGDWLQLVVIDNLTTLTEGMSATERNDFIGSLAKDCITLAKKFDLMIVLYSHLNAPDKNSTPHELGGVVKENQFTGSRALQRYSHMMFGFERNKGAVDPNCSVFRVLKNRKFGKSGFVKTYYHEDTGRLVEREWDDDLYKTKAVTGN